MATTLETLNAAAKWLHFAYDTSKITLTATQRIEVAAVLKEVDVALGVVQDMPASMRAPMTTNTPQGMI